MVVKQSKNNVENMTPENRESNRHQQKYVVVRDGYRVSDEEYSSPADPRAISEAEFWNKVETRHSWGAKVDIVEYDNRIHRVY